MARTNGAMTQGQINHTGQGGGMYVGEGALGTAGPYHNALEPFFGPPSKMIQVDPSNQFPHEAWFLPDAYAGKCNHT